MADVVNRSGARQVAGNLVRLTGGKLGAAVISLVTLAIAARSLSVEAFGVLALLHGYVVLVGGIVAFSGWHGIVRYGGQALADGRPGRLVAITRAMAMAEVALAVIAIAIAALAARWAGPLLDWTADVARFAPIYSLAILATVRATPQGVLQLADRFDLIGLHTLVNPAVRLGGALIVLMVDGGLMGFVWVWLASALAEGAAMWLMAIAPWRRLVPRGTTPTLADAPPPGFWRFGWITNLDITLRELAPRAVPLIVGAVLGAGAAGILSLANRAAIVLQQPAQLLGQAIFPVITRLAVAGDWHDLARTVRRGVVTMTGAAIALALLMAVLAETILTMLGGPAYRDGAVLLALMVAGRALVAGVPALSAALTALGRPGWSIRITLATGIGLLPLLVPMLGRWGVEGAGLHAMGIGAVTLAWMMAATIRALRTSRAAAMHAPR